MADGPLYHVDASTPIADPDDVVTLTAGTAFCVCRADGDIEPGSSQGYFAADTRMLSILRLRVDGATPRVLRHESDEDRLTALGIIGDPIAPRLLVHRSVQVSNRLVIDIDVHNLVVDPVVARVDLTVGADFADLFEVKRGERPRSGFVGAGPRDGQLLLSYDSGSFHRSITVHCDRRADILRDGLHVELAIDGHEHRAVRIVAEPSDGGHAPAAVVAHRPSWREHSTELRTSIPRLVDVWRRSSDDLQSLLMLDPDDPHRTIIAAGSPWFMALFGRDSLISSWQALVLDSSLAMSTLRALADRQGRAHRPETAEQPGRILHEVRRGEVVRTAEGWGEVYYGSVDATPLFVMTLEQAWRWGAPHDDVRTLLPAAERAVEWMIGPGDPDHDGFVEYAARTARRPGLTNQAWKDSDDAVRHPDGTLAVGPITMVEVQGYCDAALRAMATLRDAFDTGDPAPLLTRADALRDAIEDRFWIEDDDCYALALDGDDRQVRSVSTNAGHLLWTGTASPEHAERLATRLLERDVFTGFGLRTLSSTNPGYNPLSYHCGSVWPHDTAIVAAGMLRYGLIDQGSAVAASLLDAAGFGDGRLPELFGGFDRDRFERPVPYPSSCSPQAWSAGAPLLLVRALLGLQPDVPGGVLRVRPCLAADVTMELSNLRLGDADVAVRASGTIPTVDIDGAGLRADVHI
jgi:glycogen debranching enzyme